MARSLSIKIKDAVRAANSLRASLRAAFRRGVFRMIRYECLQLLASKMTDQLVVTSQSGQRIEWSHLSRHEGNLLGRHDGLRHRRGHRVGASPAASQSDRPRLRRQRAAVAVQSRDVGQFAAEESGRLCLRQRRLQRQPHQLSDRDLRKHGLGCHGAGSRNQECMHDPGFRKISKRRVSTP